MIVICADKMSIYSKSIHIRRVTNLFLHKTGRKRFCKANERMTQSVRGYKMRKLMVNAKSFQVITICLLANAWEQIVSVHIGRYQIPSIFCSRHKIYRPFSIIIFPACDFVVFVDRSLDKFKRYLFLRENQQSYLLLTTTRVKSLGKTYRKGVICRCNLAYLMVK